LPPLKTLMVEISVRQAPGAAVPTREPTPKQRRFSESFHFVPEGISFTRHFAGRLILLYLGLRSFKAIRRVAEKDHAQDRHEVIAGSKLGVGAEVVCCFPEVGFELFDVFEGLVGHAALPQYPGLVRVRRALQGCVDL
jgi:hypothetical protein